jgi:DNA polymerase
MKQSQYLEILSLVKTTLSEYNNWGEKEIPKKQNSNTLETLKQKLANCRDCPLGKTRLNCVFGEGNSNANLMFIGEGPGFDEDHKGMPFIGRAGQLLTKIIEAMSFKREEVFIANIVKCHPMKNPDDPESRGNDRPPTIDEMNTCKKYLDMQIEIINPAVIVTLGASAIKGLLPQEERTISHLRGNWLKYRNVTLMPTYHPAALLRNPELKKPVWEDMKLVMQFLKEHSK